MSLPLQSAPKNICLLRLSAVGDICHALPIVRTLQMHWPDTKITWIIGKLEASLIGDIPDIEFIIFDKSCGLSAYYNLHKMMRGRHFDVLLHMQMSLRASLASLFVPATIRLGFDNTRAKDFQWLFTNHKIAHHDKQHVIDSFFCFTEALGINEHILRWDIPIPDEARHYAEQIQARDKQALVISPCSSMSYRNWNAEAYAAIADYAIEKHNMQVILTGGPSAIESDYGQRICTLSRYKPVNLIGQTSLKQLLALLDNATAVLAPDSGPAHMATAVGTPVIGLYAATNPDRARPYLSGNYVVNKYPEAIQKKFNKRADEMPWGTRVRDAGTMDLISVDNVIQKLDQLINTSEKMC